MRRAFLVALAALVFPAGASAHATLRAASPGFGRELRHAPAVIRLHFDQVVKVLPGAVKVVDVRGRDFAGAPRVEGTDVVTPVRRIPTGAYTVRWSAISADSHVVSGVWTFGVRVPAPPVTDAYGAGGPTRAEDVVRWIWFVGLALAIGTLGLRLICLRGLAVPLAAQRRLSVAAGLGAAVSIVAGIAAFSLRSEDALQLPLGKFLYGDLSPMAATRFGEAFVTMTLGFALVLALVFCSWLLDRVEPLVPAFALSLLLVGGLSLSGHDAVDPGSSWKTEIADWVHLAGASLWIGGLAALALVAWSAAPQVRSAMFLRFSRLATVLVAVVLAAGTYLGIVRLPRLADLWTTGYGHVLIVKLALVALALAWGGFHHTVVRPRIARADAGALGRIGRSLAGESLVGVAVLLLAAVLVDSRPPPRLGQSATPSASSTSPPATNTAPGASRGSPGRGSNPRKITPPRPGVIVPQLTRRLAALPLPAPASSR
ncbi:MAG TPA: CopD family protein [Gaiellaceae bacterium]|nr:CopD family protein [Gaiellaceae bacterium]